MTDKSVIQFENVVKRFGEKTIINGASFAVNEGEVFCLIGGSGTGKSVSLKLLLGLLPLDDGEIFVRGRAVTEMNDQELTAMRRKIGMVFQGGALFDSLTVAENIAYPLEQAGERDQDQIDQRVKEVLALVDLSGSENLFPSDLSGGMVKRVGLARALAPRPSIILFDEPTAGLDPTNVIRIDELILRLKKELQVTSVVVTHHMESVERIADRVALLADKKIAFLGSIDDLRQTKDPVVTGFVTGRVRPASGAGGES